MSAVRLILILLLLPVLLPSPAGSSPQTSDMKVDLAEDLTCIVKLPFDAAPRTYSCSPILFEFTNDGADRMIRVEVSADGNWSGVFNVPGGTISRGFIYLPTTGYMTSNDIVFYDLETGEQLKRTRGSGSRGSRGSRDVFILTVTAGDPPQVANDFCTSSDVRFGTVSPQRLPDSWIGLTGVDLLIVPHETWASSMMKIEPTLDWIVMGGNCLIVDVPEEARQAVMRTLESKGALARVTELYRIDGMEGEPILNMGAGEVRFIDRATLLESGYYVGPPNTTRNYSAGKGSPRQPELHQLEGPPFLPVLFFLLVFSVLVGPVGWWYAVGRKGQPLIYFVLAPSLSACVVVIVIAVDFLNHGVTPRAACIATEVIDQTTQRRITLSQFALYFPFSIGRSLEGDFNELPHFLSVQNDSRSGYNLRGLTAAPTEKGMKYGGTALPARRTSWYAREKIRPERRRLIIWMEDGRILVENHLGMDLEHLLLCCDGTYATLDRLAEGEKLEAKAVDPGDAMAAYENINPAHNEKAVFHPLVSAFYSQWGASFKEGKNTYTAERSSGFEELLFVDHADVEDSKALVLGIY